MSSTDERILSGDELLTLGRQLLADGREIKMRLGGHSMFPTLRPGDVATIIPKAAANPRVGDVAVCDRGDRWVAHRLILIEDKVNGVRYITQGDSCMRPDGPFGKEHLMGRIIAVNRNGRVIHLDKAPPRFLGLTRPLARLYLKARAFTGRCLRMISPSGPSAR